MAQHRKKVFRLLEGLTMNVDTGKQGPAYFEELLDASAKASCCGVDCCAGGIRLRDQITTDKYLITVENGAWVFTIV